MDVPVNGPDHSWWFCWIEESRKFCMFRVKRLEFQRVLRFCRNVAAHTARAVIRQHVSSQSDRPLNTGTSNDSPFLNSHLPSVQMQNTTTPTTTPHLMETTPGTGSTTPTLSEAARQAVLEQCSSRALSVQLDSCSELLMRQAVQMLVQCCGHSHAFHQMLFGWYVPRRSGFGERISQVT